MTTALDAPAHAGPAELTTEIRDQLFARHKEAVDRAVRIYTKFALGAGHTEEDLRQEACLALLAVIERYWRRPAAFLHATAQRMVATAVVRNLCLNRHGVRINDRAAREVTLCGDAREALRRELNREPTVPEIVDRAGYSGPRRKRVIQLYRDCCHDGGLVVSDDRALEGAARREPAWHPVDLADEVAHVLAGMTPYQRAAVEARYGLGGAAETTYRQIAAERGTSVAAVSLSARRGLDPSRRDARRKRGAA